MEPALPDASRRPRASARGRSLATPLLALAGIVLLFLAEPIVRFPTAHYCFADFVQSFSLIQVEPGRPPENPFMGDPAVIYLPWAIHNRTSLREGDFPVWNPYNGGGVPHLANYQSGVLSPYNFPFYLLDLKTALLASAFLKLFAIAAFTFLFLRTCGLARSAALVGATGFTFAGYHVVWVSGAITATAATLPAACFFAELVFQRAETARREVAHARLALPLAGLTLSLAFGLLAGHPENLYVGGLLLTGYLGFRLWQLRSPLGTAGLAALAGRFLACAVVAVTLAAIQLLPFLEYLIHSEVITGRTGLSAGLTSRPMHLLPLFLTPQILGNATIAHRAVASLPVAFPEAIAPYSGAIVLFLAGASLPLLRAAGRLRFFFVVMGLWLVYTFDPLGIAVAFRVIPGLAHVPISRSHDVWLFAVSCAAAWLVDALITRRAHTPPAWWIVAAGLATLAAGLWGARWLTGRYRDTIGTAPERLSFETAQLTFFVWTFALGLAAVLVLSVARSATLRRAGAALLIAGIFLQTGFHFRQFNPTIDDGLVYPVTDEMARLQRIVRDDTLLVAGGRTQSLVADSNLVYGLALPNNYDGIWIRHYDRLYRRRFGAGSFPRTPLQFDRLGLKLFGVDYVLGKGPLVDTALVDRRGIVSLPEPLPPLGRDGTVQTFVATEADLQAIAVYAVCRGDLDAGSMELRLEEAVGLEVVAAETIPCSEIGTVPRWIPLTFPAIASSEGTRYRVAVDPQRQGTRTEIVVHSWAGFDYSSGMFAFEGARREATLAFDFAYDLDAFLPLTRFEDRRLYRFRAGRSRYYTVGRAVLAKDDDQALVLLEAPGHDPMEVVVLSDAPRVPDTDLRSGGPGRVEIVSEAATRIELEVGRSQPGYLVLAKPHYPGWKAYVDGEPRPLVRANYAFMAVGVPAGNSRVSVRYEPASVRWGAVLSLTTVVAGCGWLGWRSRRRRS